MADFEPRAEVMTGVSVEPIPWSESLARLSGERFYWMATVHTSGRPHVRPVLAVWLEGALYSTTNAVAQKGKNIARDPRCSVTARTDGLDLVLEGEARRVTDAATLQRVADTYLEKYEWPPTVQGDAFTAPYGAPTAGLPPYLVYEIKPTVVFGFGTSDELGPRTTRYRF
jgi:nitroimidazol reductase NimA-like FMN-containing flavoprotein (pyridoxamine 5'-phosphate oxidase superfamily)